MTTVPDLALNNGQTIPQLGFGVFQIEPDETAEAVQRALEIGYRHIDTAEMYRNEKGVGEGVRASGLDRSEVFLTSKLSNAAHRPDDARAAFDGTLAALGVRLRRPVLDPLAAADALRRRLRLDLADAGGVLPRRTGPLDRACPTSRSRTCAGWRPRPRWCPPSTRSRCTRTSPTTRCARTAPEHGILTEAWSPIAQGRVLDDPTITAIADRVGQEHGPGHAALAHPARRHRLPEVGHAVADQGELRDLRLRAGRGRHDRDQRAGQGRGRAGPAPTRTRFAHVALALSDDGLTRLADRADRSRDHGGESQ